MHISVAAAGRLAVATASASAFVMFAGSALAAPRANPLSGLTANQIAVKAFSDLKTAPSVQMAGTIKASGLTIKLNLADTQHGCTGTMHLSGKGGVVIVESGNSLWLRPDDQFWQYAGVSASDLSAVSGKWIKVTGSAGGGSFAEFGQICSPRGISKLFTSQAAGLVKGATTKISGKAALQLKDLAGESIYVSVSTRPEILRVSAPGTGTLSFSAYGKPVSIIPPPAADVISVPGM